MSRGTEVPDVRLKIRTEGPWITASVWSGDKRLSEIARLHGALADGPGGPLYQAWFSAVAALFSNDVGRAIGADVACKRKAPDYRGETDHDD